jgi:hypothetical protein
MSGNCMLTMSCESQLEDTKVARNRPSALNAGSRRKKDANFEIENLDEQRRTGQTTCFFDQTQSWKLGHTSGYFLRRDRNCFSASLSLPT